MDKKAVLLQQQDGAYSKSNNFYHYDIDERDENRVFRDDISPDKYENTNTPENFVDYSETHNEAVDSFLDGKMRHLSETVVKMNSAVEIASQKIDSLPEFVKEHTDVFSNEGEESDYLFPPCHDNSAIEHDSLYGFVVSTSFVYYFNYIIIYF